MSRRRFTTVFLDRDGTLNVKAPECAYITAPRDLWLLRDAARSVRRLNEHGVRVIVVTNQRGVALGRMSAADLAAVRRRLAELLAAEGAWLDAEYACVHHLHSCGCRKPLPGLLLRAAADDPAIRLDRAVMIGDAESDVEAGRRAGTATVRLAIGAPPTAAEITVPDLRAAVQWVLAQTTSI